MKHGSVSRWRCAAVRAPGRESEPVARRVKSPTSSSTSEEANAMCGGESARCGVTETDVAQTGEPSRRTAGPAARVGEPSRRAAGPAARVGRAVTASALACATRARTSVRRILCKPFGWTDRQNRKIWQNSGSR